MNKEQIALLDIWHIIALLPDKFTCTTPLDKLGYFWETEGTVYYDILDESVITVQQFEGQKSACLVPVVRGVESIDAIINGKKISYSMTFTPPSKRSYNVCTINFDFDNPIEKLIFHFNFGLTDSLELKVETLPYEELKPDYHLRNLLRLSHACGRDLVNIRFQPAIKSIAYTKIHLYTILQNNCRQLMASYRVENKVFFKSIKDLAYGNYSYKVEQYDKNDKLIVESDYIDFQLFRPYAGR